jgi:hypothetical protein
MTVSSAATAVGESSRSCSKTSVVLWPFAPWRDCERLHACAARWDNGFVAHRRLDYQHALRGIAFLRMLAGERSPSTPIGADRWGNELIPDYPPITDAELEQLKARIEELLVKAADRLE